MSSEFPMIDSRVKHVGVSTLRQLNTAKLRKLEGLLVIQDNGDPVAVILSYKQFMAMQAALAQPKEKP